MKYVISGKVIRGEGYGKKIGFPTINLSRKNFLVMRDKPAFGVYAGRVRLQGKTYRAGIIIGPMDKKGWPKIEAYLIVYKGNAYGKTAVFEIKKFLRKFRKFKSEKELIKQIEKDIKMC
jgi:FAD synthase